MLGGTLQPLLSHPVLRAWQSLGSVGPESLVYPVFIHSIPDALEATALPEQFSVGVNRLKDHLAPIVADGLKAVLLFGQPGLTHIKDFMGSSALAPDSPVCNALRVLSALWPDLLLIADVCLCAYTDHGHCGIPNASNHLDAKQSCMQLGRVAVSYATAGAHVVAPSDMLDGHVAAIRGALNANGLAYVAVMSYSPKFQSALYGPFRDTTACSLISNRSTYQLPIASSILATRALRRDIMQGADILIVKPAGWYLDIIAAAQREFPESLLAAYQVSGEYTMICASARSPADLRQTAIESVQCIRRAGASLVITYFTPLLLK